jgi:flavin-dependent dehydrogenase
VDGRGTELAADFIVDASSRGTLTLELLDRVALPRPEEKQIGIGLHYATAMFRIPSSAPPDWRAVLHRPSAESGRGGLLVPVENGRWQVNLTHMHDGAVPEKVADFIAFARTLRTPTIYSAIKDAVPIGPIYRFVFPGSIRRRFEALERFPDGLLPLGDAICRFNPAFGQGMSVAAQQAAALGQLIAARVLNTQQLKGLARCFFAAIDDYLTAPWATAESDFIYEKTRGERPRDFRERMNFNAALQRLASEDATMHQVMSEVSHLVKPSSALRAPEIVSRVSSLMASSI